jgi:hypothetical protein
MEADDSIAKLHLFLETLSATEGNNSEPCHSQVTWDITQLRHTPSDLFRPRFFSSPAPAGASARKLVLVGATNYCFEAVRFALSYSA